MIPFFSPLSHTAPNSARRHHSGRWEGTRKMPKIPTFSTVKRKAADWRHGWEDTERFERWWWRFQWSEFIGFHLHHHHPEIRYRSMIRTREAKGRQNEQKKNTLCSSSHTNHLEASNPFEIKYRFQSAHLTSTNDPTPLRPARWSSNWNRIFKKFTLSHSWWDLILMVETRKWNRNTTAAYQREWPKQATENECVEA